MLGPSIRFYVIDRYSAMVARSPRFRIVERTHSQMIGEPLEAKT